MDDTRLPTIRREVAALLRQAAALESSSTSVDREQARGYMMHAGVPQEDLRGVQTNLKRAGVCSPRGSAAGRRA